MKSKNIKDLIRVYFFQNPTAKMRVRQIERATSAPLPSVIRYVGELEKDGIIKRVKIAGVVLYSADRSSENFLLEKKLFNVRKLFESGLVKHIVMNYGNPLIIVFGSYSKGEDIEKSDIDIYVQTPKKQEITAAKFEHALGRPVHIFNYKGIDKIQNRELANNVINGVILNGYLEVFK